MARRNETIAQRNARLHSEAELEHARAINERDKRDERRSRFLCEFDDRHWTDGQLEDLFRYFDSKGLA